MKVTKRLQSLTRWGLAAALAAAAPPLCPQLAAAEAPRPAAEVEFVSTVRLGGPGDRPGFAVDASGAMYIAGTISEPERAAWEANATGATLVSPKAGGAPLLFCGPFPPTLYDAYIAKISPDGQRLEYLKFLSGRSVDEATGVAVDSAGNAYVTGFTSSSDFPSVNAYQARKNFGNDIFVVKLSPAGEILQSTFLGGDDDDEARGITVDASGAAYITGITRSPDFPAGTALPRAPLQGGILSSEDGGVSWMDSSTGLVERRIRAIIPDPTQDALVYAITSAGLFRSSDRGGSWQAVTRPPGVEQILTVAIDPKGSAVWYAGTDAGIFKTADSGASWQSLNQGLSPASLRVTQIVIDPENPATLYIGTAAGAFKSNDGGQNWRQMGETNAETRALVLDPQSSSTIYVSHYYPGTCGFFSIPPQSTLDMSTDGGETFVSIAGNLSNPQPFLNPVVEGMAVDPLNSSTLYLATTNGVFRTVDGGAHWEPRSEGLPSFQVADTSLPQDVGAVIIDPASPARLYAVVMPFNGTPGGIFRSEDAAATWQALDLGPGAPQAVAVAIDPRNPARLYAGTTQQPDQDGFVAKLSADGRSLEFSAIVGGSADDTPLAIAIDRAGYSYIAGNTLSDDFPLKTPVQANNGGKGDMFVTKLATDGASLIYSTFLGGSQKDEAAGLALDPDGNAYLTGKTQSPDFPAHSGVHSRLSGPSDAFVTKLSADGSAIAYSGFLGGIGDDSAVGIAVDPEGQAYLTGMTGSPNFPVTAFGSTCNRIAFKAPVPFVTKLDRSGARVEHSLLLSESYHLYAMSWAIAADATQSSYLLLSGRTLFNGKPPEGLPEFPGPHVAKLDLSAEGSAVVVPCAVNAASLISGPIAPGEVVTLYGNGLGPEDFAVYELGPDGRVPTELAGTRVLLDGEPLPVLHAQANQVSVVSPLSVAGKTSVTFKVERGGESAQLNMPVAVAHPGLFTQDFSGIGSAVFNQDWSLNSFENGAPSGSVVTVFLNGGGLTNPEVDPAAVAALDDPLAELQLPVTALINQWDAPVEYAGTAPGQLHGVMQVNVRIPLVIKQQTSSRDFRLVISVNGALSQAVEIVID